MGGRYWISGVQLGMLEQLAKNYNYLDILNLLHEIQEKQFISNKKDFKRIMSKLQ